MKITITTKDLSVDYNAASGREEREAIRARVEAVPPEPWEIAGWGYEDATVIMPDNVSCRVTASAVGRSIEHQQSGPAYKIANLVVHAPEDLRRLLAKSEEDERELERLKGRLDFVEPLAQIRLGMIVEKDAELALREQRISELETERSDLGSAIAEAAHQAGIYNMQVPLTGPMLVMLCDDMSGEILRLRKANEEVWEKAISAVRMTKILSDDIYELPQGGTIAEIQIPFTAAAFKEQSIAALEAAARQSREGEGK